MTRGLHGRSVELGAIQQGLDAARAGRTAAFALVGEPGIGKTRLTAEVADRAASAGFTVCWGRAWEAGGAPPYWPWRLLFEIDARGERRRSAGPDVGTAGGWPRPTPVARLPVGSGLNPTVVIRNVLSSPTRRRRNQKRKRIPLLKNARATAEGAAHENLQPLLV